MLVATSRLCSLLSLPPSARRPPPVSLPGFPSLDFTSCRVSSRHFTSLCPSFLPQKSFFLALWWSYFPFSTQRPDLPRRFPCQDTKTRCNALRRTSTQLNATQRNTNVDCPCHPANALSQLSERDPSLRAVSRRVLVVFESSTQPPSRYFRHEIPPPLQHHAAPSTHRQPTTFESFGHFFLQDIGETFLPGCRLIHSHPPGSSSLRRSLAVVLWQPPLHRL